MAKCDKCGKEVKPSEDATMLDAIVHRAPMMALIFASRHITCSPSRAQYICHSGFPPIVDDRPEYDKRIIERSDQLFVAEHEAAYTGAWLQLRDQYPD